jgi:dipeptidyl aminopeptidase/acylaminoacyl peptidase
MNLTLIRFALTAGLLLAGLDAASAQQTRPITLEDLWQVQRAGKPAISPDGAWVAVEIANHDMDANSSSSALWLLSADGKTRKQLTTAKGSNSGPVWSPDGSSIAFVSKRAGDTAQIHVISPNGGEARQVSKLPMAPGGLKWSADSKTIYCVVWTWPDTPDDDSFRKKERARKDDKVQAFIIDDALYRYWDHWIADGKLPVVFAVDVLTGTHKNLFAGLTLSLPVSAGAAADYDVSPDGKELCFAAESTKELGMDFNTDLYILPLGKKKATARNITTDNPGNDFAPVYAPDGKTIAFLRQTTKYFYADRMRIMLHDRAGGKNREITARFDRSCQNQQWAPDGLKLHFEAEDKGYHRLYSVSTQGNDVVALTSGFSDQSASLSKDGKHIAFLRSNFGMPATVYVLSTSDAPHPTRIETFNQDLCSRWDLGAVKEVYFKGADNEEVQMWIVYPPGFDAKKKWPLLQIVHGGPYNGIATDFHYRWNLHLFASRGYVVACINFHGSSGFGQKFTDSITGDMGTKTTIDIMKGTDWMEKEPYIDPARTAAAGASYGGYMMAWLNGHTDRFKAMICHAGVYNWHSMMASDVVRGRERPLGTMPGGGDLAKIDGQSPQRFAANFKTPTLVSHGERDFRVPVTQGFEYYNTLRLKRVPTRLIYFPDENHWILKPQNARLWHREFFAWLDKYVGHGPTP